MPSRFRVTLAAAALLLIHSPAAVRAQLPDGPPVVSGFNNGPIDVSGGGVFAQVAALPLAKGIWHLRATAFLEGTSYGAERHLTTCKLVLGADVDSVTASPSGDADGVMQPLLLTMEHKFEAAGKARLLCKSDAATGEVKIRFVKLTGVKIGKLTRRPFGGTATTIGKGSPRVIAGYRSKDTKVAGDKQFHTVASLPLPAGRWAIVAKGVLAGTSPSLMANVTCLLSTVGEADFADAVVAKAGASTDRVPIGLQVATRLDAAGTVQLQCAGDGEFAIGKVRFTAFQAGTLTIGPPGAPETSGSGNPVIITEKDAVSSTIGTGSYELVASMPLPAGSFAVGAKLGISYSHATTVQATCRLHLQGDFDEKAVAGGSVSTEAVMMFTTVHTFAAPGAAEIWCIRTDPSNAVTVHDVQFTAIRAGSLANSGI